MSKMEMARIIVSSNPGLTRKEYIGLFINEAGLTKSGASTYHQLIAKNLKTSGPTRDSKGRYIKKIA